MSAKIYDLLIVGAGPCGLACGIEAQQKNMSYLIVDKGSLTESIRRYPIQMNFFSTAENIEIGNIPMTVTGAKANRTEALQYYRRVSEYFNLNVQLYTTVLQILKSGEVFEVHTSKNEILSAKNVVIATGYFDFPRNLQISGELSQHVSKYYDEPFKYIHSKVVIVGGGNSAVEAALDLQQHNADVTMVVRKEDFKPTAKYWLMPNLRNRIKNGTIKVRFNSEVTRIEKSKIWIKEKDSVDEKFLPADFVLLMVGYTIDANLLRQAGIEIREKDLVPTFNPETLETNVEGLYLAGTVVCGVHTEKIFIENGRFDGQKIIKHILEKEKSLSIQTV